MTPKLFRGVLIASWVAGLLGGILAVVLLDTLPHPIAEYERARWDPDMPLDPSDERFAWIAFAYLAIAMWNLVELWRFKVRARGIYAGLLVGCVLVTLLAPPSAYPSATQAAFYLAGVLAGIAFAAMWWSPSIAGRFTEAEQSGT